LIRLALIVFSLVAGGLVSAAFAACSGPIDPTPPDPHVVDGDPDIAFLLRDAGQDASVDAP
jgi:hypothetical protein